MMMALHRRRREERRTDPPADDALVRSMLRLGTSGPRFIGYALALLRERDGLSAEQQAEGFGLSLAALAYMGMCVPRPERRAEDVAAVAGCVGIAAGRLAEMLDEAELLGQAGQGAGQREDDDGGR